MDDQPHLNVMSGDPPPPERPRRKRGGASHAAPLLIGVGFAATVIAVAVVLLRGGDGGEAAPAPEAAAPATTQAVVELKIVFPEGFTRKAMAERVAAVNDIAREERGIETSLRPAEYLAATRASNVPGRLAGDGVSRSLEGFLFPATYAFTARTTTNDLIQMQLDAFEAAWSGVDLGYAKKKNLTAYDVLIIASMVEGEVRVPRERKLVAAVIYNRLKAKMPLGIDATLRYGLDIPPTEAITQSDLDSNNPYNTRKRTGLPPTPIGNPGLASMQAAAHPASKPFLYFVRKKDCKSHYFAKTEAEFLAFLNGPNSFLAGPNACG